MSSRKKKRKNPINQLDFGQDVFGGEIEDLIASHLQNITNGLKENNFSWDSVLYLRVYSTPTFSEKHSQTFETGLILFYLFFLFFFFFFFFFFF